MPQDIPGAESLLNFDLVARTPGVAAMSIPLAILLIGPVAGNDGNGGRVSSLIDTPTTPRSGVRLSQPAGAVRTLVAMPAYNEEAAIAKTVLGARQHADAVLVVDDGSKDETARIAGALGAIVVRHEANRGYGGALQTIFDTARGMGAEELVIIDADGQHDPGEIPGLLAELRRGNDVVALSGVKSPGPDGFGAYGKKVIEAIRIGGNGTSDILAQIHDLAAAGVPAGRTANDEPRYRGERIAVVIPAYNEGLVIGSVALQAKQHADRVIVIDDGSNDRTAAIARLADADVIEMPENGGKAKAMMAGFSRARDLGYNLVVTLDGDGQHDPAEIPAVAAPVLAGEADLAIGSRFLDIKADIPKYRIAGQKVLNSFTNISVDGGDFVTTDSQSGFRALSRRALENLTFASEGYNIESDMIAHFAPLGLAMTEVPISVSYDVPNKHKMNPVSHGFGVLARIVGLIGYRRPLLSFGIPGVVVTLFGIGAEIYTFSEFYRTDQFHYIVFTGGFAALILGLMLVTSGLILNSLMMITKGAGPSKESIP